MQPWLETKNGFLYKLIISLSYSPLNGCYTRDRIFHQNDFKHMDGSKGYLHTHALSSLSPTDLRKNYLRTFWWIRMSPMYKYTLCCSFKSVLYKGTVSIHLILRQRNRYCILERFCFFTNRFFPSEYLYAFFWKSTSDSAIERIWFQVKIPTRGWHMLLGSWREFQR